MALAGARIVHRGEDQHARAQNMTVISEFLPVRFEAREEEGLTRAVCLAGTIPFAEYCGRVERHLESAHGIRVVTRDIPDPLTGDLDGAEIHIDCAVSPGAAVVPAGTPFRSHGAVERGSRRVRDGQAAGAAGRRGTAAGHYRLRAEAACYALSMLHRIGIVDIDGWFCDYTACDMAYLMYYYRTGEKRAFLNFWRDGTPAIEPKAVPRFVPVKPVFRLDGIVI